LKIPDKCVIKRVGAAGDPWGDAGPPPLLKDDELDLAVRHEAASSISRASMHLPRRALPTLTNADLTSMNSAPASFLPARLLGAVVRTATTSTQHLLLAAKLTAVQASPLPPLQMVGG